MTDRQLIERQNEIHSLKGAIAMAEGAEQELGIDPVMAFYRECAELAGMSLDDWLLYEPF